MKSLHKVFLTMFVTAILFLSLSTAQEKYQSEQDIQAKIDSLRKVKAEMLDLISTLKRDLREMRSDSDSLSMQYQSEVRELYVMRYGKEDGAKVASGMVWKGMSEDMLRDSWGKPDSVTSNKQPWGTYNQWYYGEITYFFKDGKMIDWEEGQTEN